jgi:ubiquinone/menaquinone biosynthesis C-methylase UbiE
MIGIAVHDPVTAHYARQGLEQVILNALDSAGLAGERLKTSDLAPIDEFHIGGRKATVELARQLGLHKAQLVLDVGSGLGGASRCLAETFGCRVTGLELSPDYCRVATMLAGRVGLADRVTYQQGDALNPPFADQSFDLLWTQHAAMNIADKPRFYAELSRVLKPGGKLAIYDILAGEGGAVHYPVPWARDPAISHLLTPQQLRSLLVKSGFEILSWQDATEQGRAWFRRMGEKVSREGLPHLGIHLLLGEDFKLMARNQVRNLEEDRIALIEAIVRRPA